MACSTCHVVLEENIHDSLEPPCEDEEDMLDMAFGLTDTFVIAITLVPVAGINAFAVALLAVDLVWAVKLLLTKDSKALR